MGKKILRVGIVGGGIIGTSTSPLYNTDKSKVTDVLRRDPEKAKKLGEELNAKFHSAPTFSSKELKSMLKKKFDLTVLAMIPGVQKKVAIECAEQDKPLYVEKMFMRNEQEAQEVVQAFKSKGIPLFVAHFCRCMPQIQYVKQLIDSNSIGNIKNIQMYVKIIFLRGIKI